MKARCIKACTCKRLRDQRPRFFAKGEEACFDDKEKLPKHFESLEAPKPKAKQAKKPKAEDDVLG